MNTNHDHLYLIISCGLTGFFSNLHLLKGYLSKLHYSFIDYEVLRYLDYPHKTPRVFNDKNGVSASEVCYALNINIITVTESLHRLKDRHLIIDTGGTGQYPERIWCSIFGGHLEEYIPKKFLVGKCMKLKQIKYNFIRAIREYYSLMKNDLEV